MELLFAVVEMTSLLVIGGAYIDVAHHFLSIYSVADPWWFRGDILTSIPGSL
jgi:hypothetical protein